MSTGRIVEVRVSSSNSPYLSSHLNPRLSGADRVLLDKCIFEKQRWLILELLVIHPKGEPPELVPLGKIAGIEEIPVFKPYLTRDAETLWRRITSGTLSVHLLRAGFYICVLITSGLVLVLLAVGISSIIDSWQQKRRRKKAARFTIPTGGNQATWNILVDLYIDEGIASLRYLKNDLRNPAKLNENIAFHLNAKEYWRRNKEMLEDSSSIHARHHIELEMHNHKTPGLHQLLTANLIRAAQSGQKAAFVNDELLPVLDELLSNLVG